MSQSKPIEQTLSKYLQDPKEASAYLDAVIEGGDTKALLVALKDVVDARGGINKLSQSASLNRETLYRTLSQDGNPTLETLSKVLGFAGLRVSILPISPENSRVG